MGARPKRRGGGDESVARQRQRMTRGGRSEVAVCCTLIGAVVIATIASLIIAGAAPLPAPNPARGAGAGDPRSPYA